MASPRSRDAARPTSKLGVVSQPQEKPLTGGNMTEVSRLGKDVLREAGPWTPTVQRLLAHLRDAGITWCPEPRGWTDDGRETLSYLKGKVPTYPLPDWVFDEEILTTAARWLRELHDATEGYDDPAAHWRRPPRKPAEVICHNDFGPSNMVFRDHELVGVIDWDFAGPGPRLWDLAHLAYRMVPLMGPENPDSPNVTIDLGRRVSLLLDAYGTKTSVIDLLGLVIERLDDLAKLTHDHAVAKQDDELLRDARGYTADAAFLRGLLGA